MPTPTIHAALSELRVLLVIDNLETVDDERVLDFLRELPVPSKAIVTTRHLRIDGGRTLRLKGLPPEIAVELVKAEETRLALERSRIPVALTEAEQWDLAKTTAGIPLAIIWTLGRLGVGDELQHVMRRLRSAKG